MTTNIEDRMDSSGLIHDAKRLAELQALPLDRKIGISTARIIEWYQYWDGKVSVSFSGGKDSTVLLHLVRSIFPDVPAVFCNTGLEFPELVTFVKKQENVTLIKPKMTFTQVITNYGYPIFSKKTAEYIRLARRIVHEGETRYPTERRLALMGKFPSKGIKGMTAEDFDNLKAEDKSKFNMKKYLPLAQKLPVLVSEQCCSEMKKKLIHRFTKETGCKPYLGNLTEESQNRAMTWFKNGCNAFTAKEPVSTPLAFWTEQDILEYIYRNKLEVAPVYGEIFENNGAYQNTGVIRSGCVFCAYGLHLEKGETRFQALHRTHPKLYDYCMRGGTWIDNPKYESNVSMEPDEYGWINWNPEKIWVPDKGLGMAKVFEMCNDIMGYEMYRW